MIVKIRLVDGVSQANHPSAIRWSSRFGSDGLSKLVERTMKVSQPVFLLGEDLTCEDMILGYCTDLSEGKTPQELGISDAVSEISDAFELRVAVSPSKLVDQPFC